MTTTKAAHTPGPWEIRKDQKDRNIVFKPYVGTIAEAYGQDMPTCEANANLIAEAPALLAALEDLVAQLKGRDLGYLGIRIDRAAAAIAKAKGAA